VSRARIVQVYQIAGFTGEPLAMCHIRTCHDVCCIYVRCRVEAASRTTTGLYMPKAVVCARVCMCVRVCGGVRACVRA
jgi:hypothetical protein